MIELPSNVLFTHVSKDSPTLIPQEFEILHMVLVGYSNEDIKAQIKITKQGVKWRLGRLYKKFGVKNRLELIKTAHANGLKFITGSKSKTKKQCSHVYAVRVEARNG
jgi:DNA-binding CsgD family transcriptional regulator